jgi:hypothetical protein
MLGKLGHCVVLKRWLQVNSGYVYLDGQNLNNTELTDNIIISLISRPTFNLPSLYI